MAPFAKLSATLYSVCCSIFLTLLISKFGLLLLLYLFLGQNVEEEKTSQELTAEVLYLNPEDFHRVNLREKKKRNRVLLPSWGAYWFSTCSLRKLSFFFLALMSKHLIAQKSSAKFHQSFYAEVPLAFIRQCSHCLVYGTGGCHLPHRLQPPSMTNSCPVTKADCKK